MLARPPQVAVPARLLLAAMLLVGLGAATPLHAWVHDHGHDAGQTPAPDGSDHDQPRDGRAADCPICHLQASLAPPPPLPVRLTLLPRFDLLRLSDQVVASAPLDPLRLSRAPPA